MVNIYQSATSVRNNFSDTIDKAIYDRPQFINRTRDHAVLIGADIFKSILASAQLHYTVQFDKKSKTFVLSTEEIDDILASGKTQEEALNDLAAALLEYAHEYYEEFGLYSRTPNRKPHLPFVIRILMLDDVEKIKEILVCQGGKS